MKAVLCDNCETVHRHGDDLDGWVIVSVYHRCETAAGGLLASVLGVATPATEPHPPASQVGPWEFCSAACASQFLHNDLKSSIAKLREDPSR